MDDAEKMIDDTIKQSEELIKEKVSSIMKNMKKPGTTIPVNNEKCKTKISLGDLGDHPTVGDDDIDMIFENLDGLIIKLGNCLFRISYAHRGHKRFTAELINETPEVSPSSPKDK